MRQETGGKRLETGKEKKIDDCLKRLKHWTVVGFLSLVSCLWSISCGYTTRPGLPTNLRTVYVKPFDNQIDLTKVATSREDFPIYRHAMEVDLTNAVVSRFQFTGLMRPTNPARADARLEGALLEFRREALSFDASQNVDEWRLNIVVSVRFVNQRDGTLIWEEPRLTGDVTYTTSGARAESETGALTKAIEDTARRIVERTVENW